MISTAQQEPCHGRACTIVGLLFLANPHLTSIHADITLELLTVVPDSTSSVQLEWKVTPTDGLYCIRNYNIQVSGLNGSQWEEEIPGGNHSFRFTGLQLIPLQEYTYCVTANTPYGQIGLKLTANFTELQGELESLRC